MPARTMARLRIMRAGRLTLVFSERPFGLAGWIVADAQGATTRVTLSEIDAGAPIDPGLFVFREDFPQGN
ncbi:MAG: LolA family protein [Alphaproteobacteria bacterium]